MDDLRARIVAEARTWIGTPWVHQHRAKGIGVDCAGLPIEICKGLNLSTFDLTDYDRLPDGVELKRLCDEQMTPIPIRDMQPADAVLIQFVGRPQHLGILADYLYGGLSLIHATNAIGKVVEHRLSPEWRAKIVGAYRLPGVPA